MINIILRKIFGTSNERELKKLQPIVDKINSLEKEIEKLSDEKLRSKTDEFKERLNKGEILDNLMVESFAVVREAAKRTLHQRHFDVQVMGAIVLHQGKIAEMKTGEGKTLVATMPIYLNSLLSKGCHVVTVNDYLAKRDSIWMGEIYKFLGLSVGLIQHDMGTQERQIAYNSDVTYGTNNEFGFDYLRDNMVTSLDDRVQRELHYAIVDEVDSILIDEARTPLIISGPAEESTKLYYQIDRIIPRLIKEEDYMIDEKARTSTLTETGTLKAEKLLGIENLYDNQHIEIVHHINQALKAHTLFSRDTDYIVKEGKVIIVDEFTGRLMPGRRYSDGLHQALEAKERVEIERENQTLATITFQNYFRLYKKLSGMTGTALTEAEEFDKIYKLEVISIPTNKPMIRIDYSDMVYRTEKEKYDAIIKEIVELYKIKRPILVGTISIEKSERLSRMLKKEGIPHNVLNAKYHEQEAEIVKLAGQKSAITIATNMAGRGTDIVLGNGVVDLEGLHILGTERHESRRIDNQLRGRSGRQGDPGSSKFYLSLEDDLMRIFGGDRLKNIMSRFKIEEGYVITHPWVTKAIENAQKRVEGYNFDIRKHLLEYDNVMNEQRTIIYNQRREILEGTLLKEHLFEMIEDIIEKNISIHIGDKNNDYKGLIDYFHNLFSISLIQDEIKTLNLQEIKEKIMNLIHQIYNKKEEKVGQEMMRYLEKVVMLQIVDSKWKDHLYAMDGLKEGIGLRAYGQRDPLIEYKSEGYEMFMDMIERIKEDIVKYIFMVQVVHEQKRKQVGTAEHKEFRSLRNQETSTEQRKQTPIRATTKIGRNDPCPCGSGKKYKKCCALKEGI